MDASFWETRQIGKPGEGGGHRGRTARTGGSSLRSPTRDAFIRAGGLDEGVNYLEKPFTPEALATMVHTVLDQANRSK